MEFERVLERLAACTQLLRLAQLAEIFEQQKSTVDAWRKAYGFPDHVRLATDIRTGARYWRPDHVAEWVRLRQRVATDGADIEEVCTIVGMHRETWFDWVKAERAPAHRWLAFGTGRKLWDREEVRTWLYERTGGYAVPSDVRRCPRTPRTARSRTPPRAPRGRRRKSEAEKETRP